MKKIFTLITLALVALLGGASSAKAETTTLYERGTTQDNAWTAENISEFTASWADLTLNEEYGATFKNNNNGSFKATKAISVTKNAVVNVDAYVELYSNTSAGFSQCSYFRFGNIYIGENDQDKISRYSLDGMPTGSSTSFNHGTYRGGSSPIYHIQIEVNTAKNTLNKLVVSNEDDSKTWVNITTETALTNASYADVEFGFNKTTRTTTEKIVGLKSIKITETPQEVTTANYTVKYKFGENILNTVSGNTTVGNTVNAESPVVIDGQKYYATGTTSLVVSATEANNELNVDLRKANEWKYIVKSSVNTTLATGVCIEGEKFTVALPRYINVDGNLYETAKGSDWYHKTYAITQDNQVETVTYDATSITDVVYYAEAEDLPGATSGNGNGSRTSMGLTAYGTNLPVTTLAPGKYKIYMHGANGNSASRAISFNGGGVALAEFTMPNGNNQDFISEEFTIVSNTDITLTSEGSQASGVDYFYIVKTGDYTGETITVDKYATYVTPGALDFTGIENVKAYVASGSSSSTVTLTQVNKVNANEPIVLIGTGTIEVPTFTGDADEYTNMFVNAATATEERTAGSTIYALSKTNGDFRIVGDAVKELPEGKAYLPVPPTASDAKPTISLAFGDDNATAANEVVADDNNAVNGKFVENGKIVIKKGGKKYNAAAIEVK